MSTYRPPQGTKRSALNLKCAPFLKSVPSTITSPATTHTQQLALSLADHTMEGIERALTRQLHILVLNPHKVPILAQLRQIKVRHRLAELRQSDEFFAINACRVSEHTTAVDDGDSLV